MKNVEIERKFLVQEKNIPKDLKKYKKVDIVQGFIYLMPAIRVRKYGKKYFLTVKSKAPSDYNVKNDIVRSEYEIEITKKVFEDLLKLCVGRVVRKTRYFIPYGKNEIELDIFLDDLKGLVYAEVEFNSLKNAHSFVPPRWLFKDVTGINKYKNTSLSICKNIKNLIKY